MRRCRSLVNIQRLTAQRLLRRARRAIGLALLRYCVSAGLGNRLFGTDAAADEFASVLVVDLTDPMTGSMGSPCDGCKNTGLSRWIDHDGLV